MISSHASLLLFLLLPLQDGTMCQHDTTIELGRNEERPRVLSRGSSELIEKQMTKQVRGRGGGGDLFSTVGMPAWCDEASWA
jgi:hypothetical protein